MRTNSHNLQNEIRGAYKKMVDVVEKSCGVFVFGMFESDCVASAILDLKKILQSKQIRKEIFANKEMTKDYVDF